MKDFLELSKSRYSVRNFKPDKISEEELEKILEAGRLAPTACNYQPQKIFVVESEEARQSLKQATKMTYDAPIVLAVCYDKKQCWYSPFQEDYNSGEMDACIVTTAMMMEAADLGIGSVWIRGYRTKDIAEALHIPEDYQLVCLLPIGYIDHDKKISWTLHGKRKPIEETVKRI